MWRRSMVVMILAGGITGQQLAIERLLDEAETARARGQLDASAATLHAATVLVESEPVADGLAALRERLAKLVMAIDPVLPRRREVERKAAAELAAAAAIYTASERPWTALPLLVDAVRLDPALRPRLREVEQRVPDMTRATPSDLATGSLHTDVFRPWFSVMVHNAAGRRQAAELGDPDFPKVLAAREGAAKALLTVAEDYCKAGRWRVAFVEAGVATQIELHCMKEPLGALLAKYRSSLTAAASKELAALWKGAERRGAWKVSGAAVSAPPAPDGKPMYVFGKQVLEPPYRLQVDIDMAMQPGGAGIAFAVQNAKNWLAVELNTIGMGYSIYVTSVVDGERTVLGGCAMGLDQNTPAKVVDKGDDLYDVVRFVGPMTLLVDVEAGSIRVSTVLREVCQIPVDASRSLAGRFGLLRVPYRAPSRTEKEPSKMVFSNLVVERL